MTRKKTNIQQIENYHNEGVRAPHLEEGCPGCAKIHYNMQDWWKEGWKLLESHVDT